MRVKRGSIRRERIKESSAKKRGAFFPAHKFVGDINHANGCLYSKRATPLITYFAIAVLTPAEKGICPGVLSSPWDHGTS
jgi:hypothetical protein